MNQEQPTYITIAYCARVMGFTWPRAKRWLEKAGALVERGGKLVTTQELLMVAYRETYNDIMEDKWERENAE